MHFDPRDAEKHSKKTEGAGDSNNTEWGGGDQLFFLVSCLIGMVYFFMTGGWIGFSIAAGVLAVGSFNIGMTSGIGLSFEGEDALSGWFFGVVVFTAIGSVMHYDVPFCFIVDAISWLAFLFLGLGFWCFSVLCVGMGSKMS